MAPAIYYAGLKIHVALPPSTVKMLFATLFLRLAAPCHARFNIFIIYTGSIRAEDEEVHRLLMSTTHIYHREQYNVRASHDENARR